jgi:hypothetical protein
VTERRVFDALLAADGRVLARGAEFSRAWGRRVFFRAPDSPPLAFDVDQLHPDVLHYLGLDAESAKAHQADLDRAKQLAAERAEKERKERLDAERERAQARQKALADRAAQPAGVSAEQLITLAALRAVETANTRAQTPPPVIVIQPPPQPVYWTLPVIWTPHPHPHRPSNFQFATPFPGSSQAAIPSGSSFRFIQQDNFDPFSNGRRL